mmetsp:Transcript_70079/g.203152  ORF Transcript_70079/g.203152 Transcript_70079/m.203152 type:complete len:281 (+) Transcript_70079:1700-2542(+)
MARGSWLRGPALSPGRALEARTHGAVNEAQRATTQSFRTQAAMSEAQRAAPLSSRLLLVVLAASFASPGRCLCSPAASVWSTASAASANSVVWETTLSRPLLSSELLLETLATSMSPCWPGCSSAPFDAGCSAGSSAGSWARGCLKGEAELSLEMAPELRTQATVNKAQRTATLSWRTQAAMNEAQRAATLSVKLLLAVLAASSTSPKWCRRSPTASTVWCTAAAPSVRSSVRGIAPPRSSLSSELLLVSLATSTSSCRCCSSAPFELCCSTGLSAGSWA